MDVMIFVTKACTHRQNLFRHQNVDPLTNPGLFFN